MPVKKDHSRELNGRPGDLRKIHANRTGYGDHSQEKLFFDRSGGGVTFTGGEPLAQPAFFSKFAQQCKESGDTLPRYILICFPRVVSEIIPNTDLFLADLKIMNPARHLKFTG